MKKDREVLGFFERVYQVVRMIPSGYVATYGQVATIVSHRQAARTVGWALHALEEQTDVPWHRVINAQGRISVVGRERAAVVQRALLENEGVVFDAQGRVNMQRYQWSGLSWSEIEALRREWKKKLQSHTDSGGEYPWRESNPRHMV